MPLQINHVTAASGMVAYFGKDIVDGWPLGPLKMAQNQTFFFDPHQDNFQRLLIEAQSTMYASGSGSTAVFPGTQNQWFRQGSGIPGSPNEQGMDVE